MNLAEKLKLAEAQKKVAPPPPPAPALAPEVSSAVIEVLDSVEVIHFMAVLVIFTSC
jgi:hypothetical protein